MSTFRSTDTVAFVWVRVRPSDSCVLAFQTLVTELFLQPLYKHLYYSRFQPLSRNDIVILLLTCMRCTEGVGVPFVLWWSLHAKKRSLGFIGVAGPEFALDCASSGGGPAIRSSAYWFKIRTMHPVRSSRSFPIDFEELLHPVIIFDTSSLNGGFVDTIC
jgi:hypothetical protein